MKKFIEYFGFTIFELIVTIPIIIILALIAISTINPAELLHQSRDSQRIADMNTLSIQLAGLQGEPLGLASTSYVSIPDPLATSSQGNQCQSLGLPQLPSGWVYHCAGPSYYQKTDGTGWIPLDFREATFGSLPRDPVNSASVGLYYTYTTDGSSKYELTSAMESKKYGNGGPNDKTSSDGGKYSDLYEVGPNLAIAPIDYAGGVGYTGAGNYNFSGFQPPIQTDGSGIYHLGRTLPVKFYLTDANGNYIISQAARLVVTKVQDGIVGSVPVTLATSTSDTGDLFRVSGNQYVYNLDTGQFTTGTWQLKAALDNGSNYTVLISLTSEE